MLFAQHVFCVYKHKWHYDWLQAPITAMTVIKYVIITMTSDRNSLNEINKILWINWTRVVQTVWPLYLALCRVKKKCTYLVTKYSVSFSNNIKPKGIKQIRIFFSNVCLYYAKLTQIWFEMYSIAYSISKIQATETVHSMFPLDRNLR